MDENLHDTIYKRIFDAMCQRIKTQRETDPAFTIKELQGRLNSMYIYDGNDHTGRGLPKDIEISATIAAMEHMLFEWRSSLKDQDR
ncbi:MAG: hypothetical protein EOM20_03150 [Spartobacteria bacterium]|nr:hypothetical protein [Spartobacteria bacterium]